MNSLSTQVDLPSKEELIKLVEFELEREIKLLSRPGWNSWVILGALSTIIWISLELFFDEKLNLVQAVFIFIALILTYEAGSSILKLFDLPTSRLAKNDRFALANSAMGPMRATLVFQFLAGIGIWVFIKNNQTTIGNGACWVALIYYGVISIMTVIVFVISCLELPIPKKVGSISRGHIFLFLLLSATELGIATGLLLPYVSDQVLLNRSGLKLAALLFISYQLIFLYFRLQQHKNPLAGTLHQIRRALALNRIDLATAKIQIETALDGLTVSDVLQSNIEGVLAPLRNISFLNQSGLQNAETLYAALKNENLTLKQREDLIVMTKTSQDKITKDVNSQFDLTEKAISKLEQKLKFMRAVHTGSELEISKVISQLKANVANSKDECKTKLTQWQEILSAITTMEMGRMQKQA